jgi:hypothetical protein
MPEGVAAQQLLLIKVVAGVDGLGDPAFQSGHLLISWRQSSDRDQDAAQVLDRFAGRQRVEGLVGEFGVVQAAQDRRGGAFVTVLPTTA